MNLNRVLYLETLLSYNITTTVTPNFDLPHYRPSWHLVPFYDPRYGRTLKIPVVSTLSTQGLLSHVFSSQNDVKFKWNPDRNLSLFLSGLNSWILSYVDHNLELT